MVLFIILAFSMLLLFYKFAIFDIILCLCTLDFILKGELIPGRNFYFVIAGFGFAILYELFYMILVAPGIWGNAVYGEINPEEGISKFIVIFTYFSFFAKFGALLFLILILLAERQKQNSAPSYNYQPAQQV